MLKLLSHTIDTVERWQSVSSHNNVVVWTCSHNSLSRQQSEFFQKCEHWMIKIISLKLSHTITVVINILYGKENMCVHFVFNSILITNSLLYENGTSSTDIILLYHFVPVAVLLHYFYEYSLLKRISFIYTIFSIDFILSLYFKYVFWYVCHLCPTYDSM